MPVKMYQTFITPERAAEIITRTSALQGTNRRLKGQHINDLVDLLLRGRWVVTGEAIKFDRSGILIDGNHRCHASVKSGVGFATMVVEGLEPEAQDAMDSGKSRTAGDVLAINGYGYATTIAAACKLLIGVANNTLTGNVARLHAMNPDVLDYVARHPDVVHLAPEIGSRKRLVAPGLYLAAYTLMHRESPEDAAVFDAGFTHGAELRAGNPILTLRESLLSTRKEARSHSQYTLMSALLRTWLAWRADVTWAKFMYRYNDGPIPIPARYVTGDEAPGAQNAATA